MSQALYTPLIFNFPNGLPTKKKTPFSESLSRYSLRPSSRLTESKDSSNDSFVPSVQTTT